MKNPFSIEGLGKPNPVPTSESKFTGVFLPRQVHSYLSLFTLCEKISKAQILRGEIEKWYVKSKSSHNVQGMILKVAAIAQEEWESRKRINKNVWKGNVTSAFELYLIEIETSLKQKSLSKIHIIRILKELKR